MKSAILNKYFLKYKTAETGMAALQNTLLNTCFFCLNVLRVSAVNIEHF